MKYFIYTTILLASAFFISSCESDVSRDGRLKVYLMDAPASIDSVIINITGVDVHLSGWDWFNVNDTSGYFDLLQLTNGASVVLGDHQLQSGHYTQLRLILGDGNYVIDNGVKHELVIPSGAESGLKLTHQFTIEPDNVYELYLDFDVDKSIEITGEGEYKLKPTIRVQPAIISGTISGTVLPLDADAKVWTISDADTISAFPDQNGFFKLMCIKEGTYQVHVTPANILYQSLVIDNVIVNAQENTDLGIITLVQ